jgi:hypothetical protein
MCLGFDGSEYRSIALSVREVSNFKPAHYQTVFDVTVWRGILERICSDNGPEFAATELRK